MNNYHRRLKFGHRQLIIHDVYYLLNNDITVGKIVGYN